MATVTPNIGLTKPVGSMVEYDKIYPGYDFAGNKGYGTAAHIAAIKELGMTPIHRRSFVHL